MVDHRDQHRGHTAGDLDAVGLDELEHDRRVEVLDEHEVLLVAAGAEHRHHAPAGVKERHRREDALGALAVDVRVINRALFVMPR